MQISYIPMVADLSAPGDRRRFAGFANHFGVPIEITGKPGVQDVVVLSQAADLSIWVKAGKTKTKIIFDLCDAYLLESASMRTLLRGVVKYSFRKNKHLHLSYKQLLIETCKLADAVVCTTEAQKQSILPYCKNVHIIQDFQEKEVLSIKTDYEAGEVFNLVWEGLPFNIPTFQVLDKVLADIDRQRPIALHLLTDIEYPRAFGTHFYKPTTHIIRKVFSSFRNVYLYEWNKNMFAKIALSCDMAIIPMPVNSDGLISNKAPNKLNLFWRMGMPVLASPTPSYKSAMEKAEMEMLCKDEKEWHNKLLFYMQHEQERRTAGWRGRLFVNENHSDKVEGERWLGVFRSLGIDKIV